MLRLTPIGRHARFYLSDLVRNVTSTTDGHNGSVVDVNGVEREFEERPEEVLAMLRAAGYAIVLAVRPDDELVDGEAVTIAAVEAVDVRLSATAD